MVNFIMLAGGSGTRLFPVSRENFPKQFIKFSDRNFSLFQQTVARISTFCQLHNVPSKVWIVTNKEYKFFVQEQLRELGKVQNSYKNFVDVSVIYEPDRKNTAPAIAYALRTVFDAGGNKEEIFVALPSDHYITPSENFASDLHMAINLAKDGYIVTFGIKPVRAETGYGYIKVEDSLGERVHKVVEFIEKPPKEQAEIYMREGCFYWNSGIFVFSGKTMVEEMQQHSPELVKLLYISKEELDDYFLNEISEISIDYAIMEKSRRLILIPASFTWSDVGCWDSVYEVLEKDENGVVKKGDVLTLSCKDSLILSNSRLVTAIGLKDTIVVETPDSILISYRGKSQEVREVVKRLKSEGRKEVKEHLTEFRPWGNFTLLEEGERYKIKKIIVKPGASLSLQMHYHRSEHWIVVRGTAKVQIGEIVQYVHENESVFIPKSTVHRLENPGKIPLEIIEVQVGEYLEEDDIVRLEDNYGRV